MRFSNRIHTGQESGASKEPILFFAVVGRLTNHSMLFWMLAKPIQNEK